MSKKKNAKNVPREMSHRQLSHHKKAQRRQRIFFFGGIAIIVAVIGIILGGWLTGEYLPLNAIVVEILDTKFNTAFYIDTLVFLAKFQGQSVSELTGVAINQIASTEMMIQEAAKLGVVVTDEEAIAFWRTAGAPIEINDAAIFLAKQEMLKNKLKGGYFSDLVPATDNQIHVMAMMVESNTIAEMVREKILNGENFTLLADQYATDAASKDVHGDYGWHPLSIFKNNLYSTIPFEYISRIDAKVGDLSQPLADNVSSKHLGYWLLRVNERPDQDTANVSAIYLGSEEEAISVRAKLEAGAELGPIADILSQYTNSQQNHGELGLISITENITNVFNGYVFDAATEIGKWSQPLRDDSFYTKGGAWLVKIVEREENRTVTNEDRLTVIDKLFSDWANKLWTENSPTIVNHLTEDLIQWAVERANKKLNIA